MGHLYRGYVSHNQRVPIFYGWELKNTPGMTLQIVTDGLKRSQSSTVRRFLVFAWDVIQIGQVCFFLHISMAIPET